MKVDDSNNQMLKIKKQKEAKMLFDVVAHNNNNNNRMVRIRDHLQKTHINRQTSSSSEDKIIIHLKGIIIGQGSIKQLIIIKIEKIFMTATKIIVIMLVEVLQETTTTTTIVMVVVKFMIEIVVIMINTIIIVQVKPIIKMIQIPDVEIKFFLFK